MLDQVSFNIVFLFFCFAIWGFGFLMGLKFKTEEEKKIRSEVRWFANEMEKQLKLNEHKGGWQNSSYGYLIAKINEEIKELELELEAEILNYQRIIKEAADVGNFAMMIADVTKKNKER